MTTYKGDGITFTEDEILKPGTIFDTEYESGCKVSEVQHDLWVSRNGALNFEAYDNEGVLCGYSSDMVRRIHPC